MCEALGVSRGGFYAWLARARSRRSPSDEVLGAQVRQSFVRSDRTYGARRVWHDVLERADLWAASHRAAHARVGAAHAPPRRRGLPKDRAVWRRGKPMALLHHSDQGSQGTSEHFQKLLDEQGITCSMSRAGEVWDSTAMESFFSSLKTERTARKVYRRRGQARSDVFNHIEYFYNPTRRHSTLGHLCPVQFEQAQEA